MINIFKKLADLKELNPRIENYVHQGINLKLDTLKPVIINLKYKKI